MAQLKLAVIAYDDEEQSDEVYFQAFQSLFQDDEDIKFINHWGTIQDVISFIHQNGNNTLNEVDRIIVLDQGFKQQLSATQMVEEFVTMQQVFTNNGIRHPQLAWLTTNQESYDMCKTNKTAKGQDILFYDRVRIIRLKNDRNGEIDTGSLIDGIDGTADRTALTIRKDFKSREERAFDALSNRINATKNKGGKTQILNDASALLRQRYGLDTETTKKKKHEKEKNKIQKSTFEDVEAKSKKISEKVKKERNEEYAIKSNMSDLNTNQDKNTKDYQNLLTQAENDMKELMSKTDFNFSVKYTSKHPLDIILVGGQKGSGVSSVVANMAECFACFKQKTLIINVSANDDVTRYFKNFELKYREGQRSQVLMNKTRADNKTKYIPVTSMIDIISDLSETQASYTKNQRVSSLLSFFIHDRREHQVIIVDAGEAVFECLKKIGSRNLTSVVFVTDNRFESIQHLNQLGNTRQQLSGILTSEFSEVPLGLVINKCTNQDFIDEKHLMNEKNLNRYIPELKTPFDKMILLGRIPYYKEWNVQTIINQRACYFNDEIFEIMKIITERTVV